MADETRPLLTTAVDLPGKNTDNTQNVGRGWRHGEAATVSVYGAKLAPVAQQGTYFTATNATLGTAITGTTAPTAFSATVALLSLYNSASAGGKSIHLDS